MSLRPKTVRVADGSRARLEEAARALAGDAAAQEESSVLLVQFGLGGEPHAVELGVVERAVTHFPEVVPLAGTRGKVKGTAFFDGVAHVVVDLLEGTGRPPRSLEEIERSPALVVDREGVPMALAVEGPLELAEVPAGWAAKAVAGEGVGVAARLPNGVLVLATEWLRQFISEVA